MNNLVCKSDFRVVITSGGTTESIDQVRNITNMSTGRLGSLVADSFAEAGAEVTYVCSEGAKRPSRPVYGIHIVKDVQALKNSMEQLLSDKKFNCVIHAMAVSDYTLKNTTSTDEFADNLVNAMAKEKILPEGDRLRELIKKTMMQSSDKASGKKIDSNLENMILVMEKTPKIIQMIKKLQPDTILLGFKLLVGVKEEELIKAACQLMERSNCDFVLGNDLENIKGDQHKAILIGKDNTMIQLSTKQEIAECIVTSILNRI